MLYYCISGIPTGTRRRYESLYKFIFPTVLYKPDTFPRYETVRKRARFTHMLEVLWLGANMRLGEDQSTQRLTTPACTCRADADP